MFQKVLRLRLSDRRRILTSITTLVLSLGSQEESCHPDQHRLESETIHSFSYVTIQIKSPSAEPRPRPQEVAA